MPHSQGVKSLLFVQKIKVDENTFKVVNLDFYAKINYF